MNDALQFIDMKVSYIKAFRNSIYAYIPIPVYTVSVFHFAGMTYMFGFAGLSSFYPHSQCIQQSHAVLAGLPDFLVDAVDG